MLGLELTTDDVTTFENWRKALNGQGDGTEGSPKSNAQLIDEFAISIYGTSGQVVLNAELWSEKVYSINVTQLGAYDAIFFSPSTLADKTALENANIIMSTNGSIITFTAETTPTADITIDYFITRGRSSE